MGFSLVLFLFLCLTLGAARAEAPLKIGFITTGPVNDLGWNYAHEQGRLFLQKTLGGQVETTVMESVPESAEAERVLEKMIAKGNKLIFTTSYGYLEPASRVAKRHPDVVIMQCQRSVPASWKNMGTYFANQYELMYVTGFVAGKMTKSAKLGYVSAHPVPVLINCINSFALGAKAANPKVKVQVVWTNSWSDPALEAEASKGLIESGVDVVVGQANALPVVKTAEKIGAYAIGCNADFAKLAPKAWLVGSRFNWGPLYVKMAKAVQDHTWKPGNYFYETKDGYYVLSDFGTSVPAKIRTEAIALKSKIEQGKLMVFAGPLKDREGKERVSAGKKASQQQIDNMEWFVPGVEGALPKK
ncbi:MAG: BMP family ABC transporter substrate-binding protein [Candidatus Obscuribacterales bacterium]|nr:BMP family ABC transporter substrate-binding protein [Candidatus Obscuribacterales bacterium]